MSQLFKIWAEEDKAAGYASGENVRPALDVAVGTTADRVARDRELSNSLGLPPEVISEQRDWAEKEQKAREIEKNPLFAQWAAEDKTRAALARDDTYAMRDTFDIIEGAKISGLRHSILVFQAKHGDLEAQKILMDEEGLSEEEQKYGTFSQTPMPGVISQVGAAFKEGYDSVVRGLAGALVLAGENMQGQTTDEEGNPVPYWHNDIAARIAREGRAFLKKWELSQSAPLHPEGWGYDVVRQVPQLFGAIGVGALTGGWGAGLFMGSNIAGNEYLDLTTKKDVVFPSNAEIEEQARLMALAMEHEGEDWQKTVNAGRMFSYEAGGQGGPLYTGRGEPSEWAMAVARARIIARAVLNTETSVPQGTAAIASLGNALVQTPLERIGLGKLVNIFKTSGFGSMIKGIAEHAATEFLTETIQQHPDEFSRMWAEGVTRGDSFSDIWKRYRGEFWDITREGMYSGLVAIPFGGLGGMVRVASDASMARSARDWFVSQRAFHQKFEELKATQIAPDVARSILEKGGMTEEVSIPAADVLRLHQEGSPVLEALGWDLADVQVEAEHKGDMTVSLPWVHTSLHGTDFDAFMKHARPSGGRGWSMAEAEQFDARAAEDVDKLVAETAADEQERSRIQRETERIEAEMREAVLSIPGMRTEIKGTDALQDRDAASRDTVDSVVRHNMEIIMRLARRFSTSGTAASDFLSRIRFQGMKMDERGRLLTPEEFERHMQDVEARARDAAIEEADAPFWDIVWGRLDAGSLNRDFPDARKELGGIHGRGLFARKGKGLAINELADELKNAGLLPQDADSSTLVEMLKGKRSPKTRKAGKVSPVLLQDVVAAEQKLAAEMAAWEKQVDEQKQKPSNNLLMLEQTPLIMHMLGADFRRLYLAPHAFDGVFPGQKTNEAHNIHANITKCVLKKLPAAMADPVMVFDAKGDRLVFMLEIEDENGSSVIVPVEVKKAKGRDKKPINLVVSVYAKDISESGNVVPNSDWFVQQAQKNLRYINTAKVSEWAAFAGVQFPFGALHNTRKKKILTETDLVKLKEEFPTLYQYKKRTPLWEKAPTSHSSNEEPYRAYLSQSGVSEDNILPNSSESNTLFQTAYHGTPHRFDEFSLEHIGEGEGAQAHGWGLYFAADKKVSDDYRNRLRRGRSRGQLFEVDIPDDDVLLDEQKIFAEQPEAVKSALRSIYKSFSKEQLAPVREEMKAQVRRDKELEKRGEELTRKRQRLFNQRRALKTVNAQRPKGEGNPFSKEGSARLFELGEKYLHEMYSNAQIERLQNDADYLNVEKSAVEKKIEGLEQKIAENEQRIETKRAKERESIDKARLDTLLSRMNGSDLYSGISIVLDSPKAASEALNAAGIKGITYDGQQDGRAFVVFDDKAIQVLNTFYQGQARGNQSPIIVRGDELGVPEGAEIKEYRKAAREVYRELQKTPAHREDLGGIQFTRVGFDELVKTGADPRKWQLVPKLKEIIENAEYIRRNELKKTRKDRITAFHWLETNVELNGKILRVGVNVAEDYDGNKFYNINQDLDFWSEKYETPDNRSGKSNPGAQEFLQDAYASFNARIPVSNDGVNLYILSEAKVAEEPRSLSEAAMTRGFVTIARGQEYTIQLLKTANLSTILHETGHIALLEMNRLVSMGMADEAMARDYAVLRDYLGLKEGESLTDRTPEMVAANEKFAKAMELYLREGKAPAKGLESAFARFRRWLTRIYREVVNDPYFKGVELNDDVRQVFDRLLADENEIRRASERAGIGGDIRAGLDALGLTGSRRARVISLMQQARDQAEDKLKTARDAHRTAQLAAWKKQAAEDMRNEPRYRALRAIRAAGGLNRDAVIQLAGEDRAKDLARRAPGSVSEKSDTSPEAVAWEAGFSTPEAMLSACIACPTAKERIAELVKEKQRQHDAQFDAEAFLFEADALAAGEEELGRAIDEALGRERDHAELPEQAAEGGPVQATAEAAPDHGSRVHAVLGHEAVEERAGQLLEAMPIRHASNPSRYRQTVKRLYDEERRALLRKDWKAAGEANYHLRLNMEMVRQAEKLRQELERFETRVRKFCDQEKNAPGARYAVAALAVPCGLIPASSTLERTAQGKDWNSIEAWANAVRDEGYAVTLNPELFLSPEPQSWKDRKRSGLRSLFDELNMIMGIETDRHRVNTESGRLELKAWGKELAAAISRRKTERNAKTEEERSRAEHGSETVHAEHVRAGALAVLADGGRRGPVWKAVVRPVLEAQKDENVRFQAAGEAVRTLFGRYSREELASLRRNRVFVPSLDGGRGGYLTKENALCALLNLGNDSNTRCLMDGMGWNVTQLKDVLSLLDEGDWEFAQGVWDYLETFRAESFALEERTTGVQPAALEARAILSPSGKRFRGGYYPVKYAGRDASGRRRPEGPAARRGLAFAGVEHGSMKERAGGPAGIPLDLRLDVMLDHVSRTVHELAFRETVINVGKVLRQSDFQKAITEAAGPESCTQLLDWLADVAGAQHQTMGSLDKAVSWGRANTALYAAGFKSALLLAPFTGSRAVSTELGPQWMLHGMDHAGGHGPSGMVHAYREACSLSPLMADRIHGFEREVADAVRTLRGRDSSERRLDPVVRVQEWISRNASIPAGYLRLAVDLPTFWGAYSKALKENRGREKAAVEHAERLMERAWGEEAAKDLAGIPRSGELMELLALYYSYFSVLYNISARRVSLSNRHRDLPAAVRLAGLSMFWFVEPLLYESFVRRNPGEGREGKEGRAAAALFRPYSMIAEGRDVVQYYRDRIEGRSWRSVAGPALDTVHTLAEAAAVPGGLSPDRESDNPAVRTMVKDPASGFPLMGARSVAALHAMWDWLDGTREPELRDLIFARKQ